MKIVPLILSVILPLSVTLSSCDSRSKSSKIQVTVSIPPQQSLVEAIGGNRVEVTCLMSSSANPESFEPAMNTMVNLRNSNLYIKMGTLDFEHNLEKVTDGGDIEVLNMSDGVNLLYGTHGDCDHHDHEGHSHAADPHVWSSLRNMRIMASNVAAALSDIDPKSSEYYYINLAKLHHRIDSLDNAISAGLDTIQSKQFVVWHPSLSYFANDYGLKQITVGHHGKELSVKQLVQRIDSAMTAGTDNGVFFFQQEFDSRQAAEINRQLGAEMININPMNSDWEAEITKVANALQHVK
ncbi:MAG: zinc ABC transporter substrate-binding protein [Muribaculaceae bacterium]|nr:zinc ABC transporter substrate-binding protein [Muribaculaceae bacterium]